MNGFFVNLNIHPLLMEPLYLIIGRVRVALLAANGRLERFFAMLGDLQLYAMAQKSLDWSANRQTVLSENVANANTPGYKARDVKPLAFRDLMAAANQPVATATTNAAHISAAVEQPIRYNVDRDRRPIESKPDGNTVLLEDQMERIGQVKSRYEITLNLFRKNLSMLKTAIGRSN